MSRKMGRARCGGPLGLLPPSISEMEGAAAGAAGGGAGGSGFFSNFPSLQSYGMRQHLGRDDRSVSVARVYEGMLLVTKLQYRNFSGKEEAADGIWRMWVGM